MNLWHDVPLGDNIPEEFNTVIEIPKGSHNKYEIDKATGMIALDRANYGAAPYPFDYGFAPQTYWEDDDALDVIVLTTYALNPGILVSVRPVGIMEMTDTGEEDSKIIAVPAEDKHWDDVQDLDDVNKHSLKLMQNFFETYKDLKGKEAPVQVHGFKGKKEAMEAVEKSIKLYSEKFPQK